jgi:hypothetical protein
VLFPEDIARREAGPHTSLPLMGSCGPDPNRGRCPHNSQASLSTGGGQTHARECGLLVLFRQTAVPLGPQLFCCILNRLERLRHRSASRVRRRRSHLREA